MPRTVSASLSFQFSEPLLHPLVKAFLSWEPRFPNHEFRATSMGSKNSLSYQIQQSKSLPHLTLLDQCILPWKWNKTILIGYQLKAHIASQKIEPYPVRLFFPNSKCLTLKQIILSFKQTRFFWVMKYMTRPINCTGSNLFPHSVME